MAKPNRITVNPSVMSGQACIRGMRLSVRRVIEALALYPDRRDVKNEYPELHDEDITQALEFAARNLDDEVLPLPESVITSTNGYRRVLDALAHPPKPTKTLLDAMHGYEKAGIQWR